MLDKLKVNYLDKKAAVMMIECDQEGVIKEMNEYARKVAGDAIGNSFGDILVDFTDSFDFKEAIEKGDASQLLNVATLSDMPQTFYFNFFQEGNAVLAMGEVNHVELAELEQKMIALNSELNNKSRELIKKNSELKNLNELKNKFLGIAAHDLRSPIGLVISYADFLLEEAADKLSEEQKTMLLRIMNSAEFMINLINDLLDVSRIESGKLQLDLQQTDLIDLVKKNIELNRVLAEKKNIKLGVDHYEQIPPLQIDGRKIEQVLNNLVSNAIKFSYPGSQVRVSIFKDRKHVNISVMDYGQGIPKNEIPKLFKTFSRTSVRATEGERSTGLGLAIARNIVMGHGGDIWVESEVGKGSTFYFSIPLQRKNNE